MQSSVRTVFNEIHMEAIVSKVRVAAFSLSIDGFGAGPQQSLNDPLGKRGRELHQWFFGTRTFQAMFGNEEGSGGVAGRTSSIIFPGCSANPGTPAMIFPISARTTGSSSGLAR